MRAIEGKTKERTIGKIDVLTGDPEPGTCDATHFPSAY